jgi:molybdenum cofactor biosynthesis protein B
MNIRVKPCATKGRPQRFTNDGNTPLAVIRGLTPLRSPLHHAAIIPRVSHIEHKADAPAATRCYVLTISDTRTPDSDTSGRAIQELLAAHGHQVIGSRIVRDDPGQVRATLDEQVNDPAVQVVITTGGTGISRRDTTYEAITSMLDKRLDGFGELFRMLSYQQIGSAAMLSRACAGAARDTIIVSLPGSEQAVRLAMTRLILPELGHLVREISR